mmetsp:Transcript_6246/g.15760  ORF Transcript_6246/g.15760 Transcript_6246/m.15760 type:complete len:225 (-) Transcript_6246:1112-1786(-)
MSGPGGPLVMWSSVEYLPHCWWLRRCHARREAAQGIYVRQEALLVAQENHNLSKISGWCTAEGCSTPNSWSNAGPQGAVSSSAPSTASSSSSASPWSSASSSSVLAGTSMSSSGSSAASLGFAASTLKVLLPISTSSLMRRRLSSSGVITRLLMHVPLMLPRSTMWYLWSLTSSLACVLETISSCSTQILFLRERPIMHSLPASISTFSTSPWRGPVTKCSSIL